MEVIQFDFWARKEQRGKGVEVVGKGKWAWGVNEQMGPSRRASHWGREKRLPPSKDTWPALQYLSLRNFGLVNSVLTSHDVQGQVTVVEEGYKF